MLLYIVAGATTSLVYLAGLVLMREVFKTPIGPVFGNQDVMLYRVPPTWLLSIAALPVALVPGLAIGWIAAKVPGQRRLRCWNCGWSATYPATAVWAPAPPERPAATSAAAFEVIADDVDPWKEATAWAYAEIRHGRLPEDVEADLVAQGWPADDVAGMVERCRKEARLKRNLASG